ncbi:hypothetical protein N752_25105 [Desulforamulus aquiferis]|nr:hypothetical protein N752_25105 [Desulforamulus aquiferis]
MPSVIPNPGSADFLNLPEALKKILRLDKPDLIATIEVGGIDVPVVSIEITTTTPQSQHAKQRIPRLIAAAETGVPSLYIILNRKRGNDGRNYSLGNDLYHGVNRIRQINNVPVFIYHYPDNNGVPDHDGSFPNQPNLNAPSIQNAFRTIDTLISCKINQQDINASAWIQAEIQRHQNQGNLANVQIQNFDTLAQINTSDLGSFLRQNTNMTARRIQQTINKLPDRISRRNQTIVFRPGGRLFEHANDPYSGMLAFFDYVFCRTGQGVEDRVKNLIYMPVNTNIHNITDEFCPSGYSNFWQNSCPFRRNTVPSVNDQFKISHHLQYGCVFTKIKPLRILGYFSDMIVFQDSMLVF